MELPVGELQWVLRWGVDYVLQTFMSPTNWSILQTGSTNGFNADRNEFVANEDIADELREPLLTLLDLWPPLHVLHSHTGLHWSPHHSLLLLLLLSLLPLLLLLLLKHELLQLQLL